MELSAWSNNPARSSGDGGPDVRASTERVANGVGVCADMKNATAGNNSGNVDNWGRAQMNEAAG